MSLLQTLSEPRSRPSLLLGEPPPRQQDPPEPQLAKITIAWRAPTHDLPVPIPGAWAAARVRLALAQGNLERARLLVEDSLRLSPQDESLRRLSRLLAPPRVLGLRREDASEVAARGANREWMRQNASLHRGQWVAVRGGQLLGAAPLLDELRRLVGDTQGALVTKIP